MDLYLFMFIIVFFRIQLEEMSIFATNFVFMFIGRVTFLNNCLCNILIFSILPLMDL